MTNSIYVVGNPNTGIEFIKPSLGPRDQLVHTGIWKKFKHIEMTKLKIVTHVSQSYKPFLITPLFNPSAIHFFWKGIEMLLGTKIPWCIIFKRLWNYLDGFWHGKYFYNNNLNRFLAAQRSSRSLVVGLSIGPSCDVGEKVTFRVSKGNSKLPSYLPMRQ